MQSILQSIICYNPIMYTKADNGRTVIATYSNNIVNGDRANIEFYTVLEQRSCIRVKHKDMYNTIYLHHLQGKATYNPKDKHIAGLTYKIARKRLLLATVKLLKKEFLNYYHFCLNDFCNSFKIAQNLSIQEKRFKTDLKHIMR